MLKTVEGRRPIVKNKKYAPATGIEYDFEKVLTAFVETKSVRYEDFAKLWREKKLSLICAGRYSQREAIEFMEECMKVAFKMFLPPYGFQARVGALYLMYGLYFTQPCIPKVKIRVTRPDWVHVKGMQEEFTSKNHHDSNYTLQKLLADGAFYFCAASEEPRSRGQNEDINKIMAEELREDRQKIDDLFSDEAMEQLGLVHSQYHQLKVRIAGPDASRPDRSLDVLHDKFPSSIVERIQKHHERWDKKESSRQGKRSKPLPTIQEDGESEAADTDPGEGQARGSVGQRRARLKDMAFRGAKSKQRYKHRSIVTEASSPEKSPTKKKAKQGGGKGGLSVQWAVRSATSTAAETVTDDPDTDPSDSLLHMPQLEEDTEAKGSKAGRKRKAEANMQICDTPSKQKKTSTEDEQESASETASAAEATKSPKKRGRGRPPKAEGVARKKVGRPRKQPQTDAHEEGEEATKGVNFKAAKLRVVPLKIKDSSKKKKKQ